MQFVYLIRPVRAGFGPGNFTDHEVQVMQEHFLYLKGHYDQGRIILVGPCLDASFGICIFEAETTEAARAIMEADPAVRAGVMTAELHPYKVSLLRSAAG